MYVDTSLEEISDHVFIFFFVLEWCECNKFSLNDLNPLKSEFMVVTYKILVIRLHLFVGSDLIEMDNIFNYLRLHIGTGLKYNV